MDLASLISTEIYAITILAVFSYLLFGANLLYKVVQYSALGIIATNVFVTGWDLLKQYVLSPVFSGTAPWWMILTIPFGILPYFMYHKKYAWLARYPIALGLGIGMGMGLGRGLQTQMRDFLQAASINSIEVMLAFLGMMFVTFYFIFHKEPKNQTVAMVFGNIRKIGLWVILASFAISFGDQTQGYFEIVTRMVLFFINWIKTGFGLLA